MRSTRKGVELIPTQYRFDCKNDTGEVETFKDVLKHKIKSLHKKFPIKDYPENWYRFQEQLEKEKKTRKTITLTEFDALGVEFEISAPRSLLPYFDKTGVVGYYKDLANDTIILQMDWILKAIYATVRLQDNRLVSTRGKLRATDLEDVWKDSYTSEERSLFITYMLKSGLLAKPPQYSALKRNYTYLCPALFEKKTIDTIQWEDKEAYIAVKFNFMFGAIMQRLQVQILNYCHYEEEEVFNKKYSCFKDKTGETVWVEMFTEEKELRIFSKNAKERSNRLK